MLWTPERMRSAVAYEQASLNLCSCVDEICRWQQKSCIYLIDKVYVAVREREMLCELA